MITQDQIRKWALEAGETDVIPNEPDKDGNFYMHIRELTRFAQLVAQYQKELDAMICEELRVHYGNGGPDGDECAAAIRS